MSDQQSGWVAATMALVLLWPGAACDSQSGTATGTDKTDPPDLMVRGLTRAGTNITIESAMVWISDIRLRSCASESELRLEGPFLIDLIAGTSIPELEKVAVAPGQYCRFELDVKEGDNDPDTGGGDRFSAKLEGTTSLGIAFSVRTQVNDSFKIESQTGGFEVGGLLPTAFVVLDLDAWVAGIDFSAAQQSNGAILIDDEHNNSLLDLFEGNLTDSADLRHDEDDDGEYEHDDDHDGTFEEDKDDPNAPDESDDDLDEPNL